MQKHLESRDSLVQLNELHARKRLLRRLGFCLEDDVIAFKGRIACEISSGDELMLTELMLDGLFSNLNASQLAGVLSCFVVERNAGKVDKVVLQPDMEGALKQIQVGSHVYLYAVVLGFTPTGSLFIKLMPKTEFWPPLPTALSDVVNGYISYTHSCICESYAIGTMNNEKAVRQEEGRKENVA